MKIAAQVRAAEGILKEPFDRCVKWRKAGGHMNCKVFISRALAEDGCDPL